MKKVLGWIAGFISWLFAMIPALVKGVLMLLMVVTIYLSIPFNILSAWFTFLKDGKTNRYWNRAYWEYKFANQEVVTMLKATK